MNKAIHEVLDEVAKAKSKKDKVTKLRENKSPTLARILVMMFHPDVKFMVPDTEPPYAPSEQIDSHSRMIKESERFGAFMLFQGKTKYPDMKQARREEIFIQILESVHPKDARVLIDIITKQTPKGITKNVVAEAFPGLIPQN